MTAPAMSAMDADRLRALPKKERLHKLVQQLKNERASWEPDWKECAQFISPRRYRAYTGDRNKGGRKTGRIYDSTATYAARTLASGMMTGVSSPARPWFRVTVGDPTLAEQGDVKTWLADVTRILLTVLGRSNAYNALAEHYADLGIFGTAAMAVLEDEDDHIRCVPFPAGSYYLAANKQGLVRTFVREFEMTAEQLVARFGVRPGATTVDWSRLSTAVKTAYTTGHRLEWFKVVQVITENAQYDPAALGAQHKKFYACYYEPPGAAGDRAGDYDVLLDEQGFDEFPIMASRWTVVGEDAYASEWPGAIVLGDIKALQMGETRVAKAIDKLIDPPLIGSATMKNTVLNLLPGGITYDDAPEGKGLRPLHEVKPDLQWQAAIQDQKRALIRRGFFEDLFLMLQSSSDAQRTAREIEERHEEKMLAIGAVLERLNADLFDPLIGRVFAICLRRGLIPEPPAALAGRDLPIEYISIMAQAQKMVALAGVDHFLARVTQVVAMNPNDVSPLDKIDRDQLIDEVADMTGLPPRVVRSDDAVAALRQQRDAAAQQQQATEQAALEAQTAQRLAASDTSGKNALTDLLQAAGGPVAAGAGL